MSLCSRVLEQVRGVILEELRRLPRASERPMLLDVGCWTGAGTLRYGEALGGASLRGIEVFEAEAREAETRGIEVARVDLEAKAFPWPDASVDVVVCNQVLEHLKNIWLPMSEMHRVLRPGGHAILSVPNLSSLHNRVLLALGRQPTSIRTFGPHVRGYAFGEFRAFVARAGAYQVVRARGVGFHPVPSPWGTPLAALWPGAAHTTLIVARRTSGRAPWRDYLTGELEGGLQTWFDAG
jgi:SAM-dependent methyltransferase